MHPPKKSLGQHFLVNPGVCEKILDLSGFSSGDVVMEIGPGKGALTRPLIDRVSHVTAVELDHDLAHDLITQFALQPMPLHADGIPRYRSRKLLLMEADILQVELAAVATAIARGKRIRVVGNLPYNQATAILQSLLDQREEIDDLTLMFQREVADRLLSPPGHRAYGYLSVLVQYHCTVERFLNVPAGAFYPRPKVESTVVRLVPIRPDRLDPRGRDRFLKLISASFAAKRKTLLNNLRPLFPDQSTAWIEARCRRAHVDPGFRAETLSVEDFIALAMQFESHLQAR